MKNVKEYQLRKCIIMDIEDFKKVFVNVFGEYEENINEIDVEIDINDGIYFCGISNEDVYMKLSMYFDTEIISIHVDDCDYTGVWICYK